MSQLPLLILSAAVLTADGTYELDEIDESRARELAAGAISIESFVGHESTAAILGRRLGIDVPVNRGRATQAVGQLALVFRVTERLPEGRVLDHSELERVETSWKRLLRVR